MKKVIVQILIGLVFFLVLDLIVSSLGLVRSRDDQAAMNRQFRVRSDIYHHALAPNFNGYNRWGKAVYRVRTNDLGFVDSEPRVVPKVADRQRLLVIGDSFGEGLGLPWEKTFVGMLAKARPDIEVLNASVVSYSPIIYYRKIKWLIDEGYRFDHVLVEIDVSDIQDASFFHLEGNKVTPRTLATAPPPVTGRLDRFLERMQRLQLTALAIRFAHSTFWGLRLSPPGLDKVANYCRSAWTYNKGDPATERLYAGNVVWGVHDRDVCPRNDLVKPASGTAPSPIDDSVASARHWMSELRAMLESRNIKLSVGVHPWPAQILHGDRDSIQRKIWRDWCAGRCAHVFDFFPEFFKYADENPKTWYADLFIDGDVHFTERGNAMMAKTLAGAFPKSR